jgi:pycsar effector protein
VDGVDRPPGQEPQLESLAAVRPEPPTVQDISPQLDFLYRASETFERAVQFADAKAGGVVLILGIGILDLFRHVRDFLDARDASVGWGWLSTIACLIAIGFGILTLLQVGRALVPRRRPGLGSLFFFGVAASYPSPKEYGEKVWFSRERELFDAMATQAWNLAGIAGEKYKHLRRAYVAALVFASFWAVARLGLSLSH